MELNQLGCVIFVLISLCSVAHSQLCLDKYRRFPNHTMCLPWSKTRQDKHTESEIVRIHNDIRANVSPAAANMLEMEYFKTLAIEAQIWAEQCTFAHDDFHLRFQPARYDVGQNILTSPANLSWFRVINQWRQENSTFIYGNSSNLFSKVGNYSQLVYAETRAVGCGMSNCNGTYFYVCNYAPRLAQSRLSTPYEASKSSNSCDSCPIHCDLNATSTLCSCEGKFCLNGGKLNLTTCQCECVAGVKSYNSSDYCTLLCEPNGDSPQCSGIREAECRTNETAIYLCPWKCGICPWGDAHYRGGVPLPFDCLIPRNVSHGNVSYNGYTDGKIVSYVCHSGYVLSTVDSTRVCRNGNWSGPEPTCDAIPTTTVGMPHTTCNGKMAGPTTCPPPRPVTNAHVAVVNYTTVQLAVYSCDPGYHIATGDQALVCENGRWNGTKPICRGSSTCPPPRSVTNGQVNIVNYTNVQLADYSCDAGYYIATGNQTLVCENGRWSGAKPTCRALPSTNNSSVTNVQTGAGQGCKRNSAGRVTMSSYGCLVAICVYMLICLQ